MDPDPEKNQPPKANNSQYLWLSPLQDIQPSLFSPETATNTNDDPMSRIDSTLFAEELPRASASKGIPRDTGCSNNLSVDQNFRWPTMREYVTNPTINGTLRRTGTDWPNSQHVHPNNNGNHNNESDTGPNQNQAGLQRRQRNQQDHNIRTEEYSNNIQYRDRLQVTRSRQINNTNPMALIGTPATSTGSGTQSTDTVDIPRRPKKHRSPIRFPSPDEDETHNLGWGLSDLQSRNNRTHFTVTPDRETTD